MSVNLHDALKKASAKMDKEWAAELHAAVEKRMKFINEHREELVEAFIAKTGCQPDECELVIENCWDSGGMQIEITWVRRISNSTKDKLEGGGK